MRLSLLVFISCFLGLTYSQPPVPRFIIPEPPSLADIHKWNDWQYIRSDDGSESYLMMAEPSFNWNYPNSEDENLIPDELALVINCLQPETEKITEVVQGLVSIVNLTDSESLLFPEEMHIEFMIFDGTVSTPADERFLYVRRHNWLDESDFDYRDTQLDFVAVNKARNEDAFVTESDGESSAMHIFARFNRSHRDKPVFKEGKNSELVASLIGHSSVIVITNYGGSGKNLNSDGYDFIASFRLKETISDKFEELGCY